MDEECENAPVESKEGPKPNLTFPYTDGALEVENQILYVSKSRLSDVSPVFKSMFESDFKEKDMKAIKLPGKKVEDVELFLDSIYRSNKNIVTVETVIQIFPLAHEFMTRDILSKCEKIIMEHCNANVKMMNSGVGQNISLNQLLSYLAAIEKFSFQKDILETLAELTSLMEFSVMTKVEGFRSLTDATKCLVMSKRLERFERIFRNPQTVYLKESDVQAFNSLFKLKEQV